MKGQVSRLDLERFILGELPELRAQALEKRLKLDPELGLELEQIKRSNREDSFLYPAIQVVPRIRDRCLRDISESWTEKPIRRLPASKHFFFLFPALAAALILAIVILPGRRKAVLPSLLDPLQDSQLVKGLTGLDLNRTQLLVFRKRGQSIDQLTDGESGRAGDILQLAYVSAEKCGVILSIDGRGTVSLHFPDKAGEATVVESRRKILLPQAVELDDAPLFERFFFVTSETPLDVRAVLRAAEALARNPRGAEKDALQLPPGLNQTSFIVRK